MELYLKTLAKLRDISAFDLDDAKKRPLVLTGGYRYLGSPPSPPINRMTLAATSHLPIKAELLFTSRYRVDLDWSNGNFKWRAIAIYYRSNGRCRHALTISYPTPALRSATRASTRNGVRPNSTRAFFFLWESTFHLKPHCEHQNTNTGKHPINKCKLGITLNIYYSNNHSSLTEHLACTIFCRVAARCDLQQLRSCSESNYDQGFVRLLTKKQQDPKCLCEVSVYNWQFCQFPREHQPATMKASSL